MSDARVPGEQDDSGLPATVLAGGDTIPAGASSAANRQRRSLESRLPAWLVRHPLIVGWCWIAVWLGFMALSDSLGWADWTWYAFVAISALPTLIASLWVLHATPRALLKPSTDTVLSHFFVRFLTLIFAFLLWGVSVVASASISSTIQAAIGANEREVTALGLNLLLVAIPAVIVLMWMALIVRCAWFLRRLRGWRQTPLKSKVPKKFLRSRPRLRAVVIGLAHPGLLLVGGLGASLLALFLDAAETTLNVYL
ncbi:hypothetical protein [Glaciibacter superstes]|uniref:hypothetical protein n=1 Tax=Glaciibacter superstes TaxID=501023 RepID=UPI000479BF0E|nr:hypothetical protein [Glaciibacter superstes]